ncbi:DUF6292 family protein [Pseudonocardia bannensis]|uniref:STAS domain-containing protein n=1 Tax=Pseudonocardia bannensis TaxID=630973 RepID=A0A848DN13_9PSEU|nr:DUF6292 family protein [Pseudonocardia bannensis]NMH93876.1 STAS domain-containing protein [Pseudonocardia bannensis]
MTILHDRSPFFHAHPRARHRTLALARHMPGLTRCFPALALSAPAARRPDDVDVEAVPRPAGTNRWFDLTVHRPDAPVVVLRVAGTLDSHTAPRLELAVEEHLSAATQILVVDLRDVVFFGGSGLRCMMRVSAVAGRTCTWLRVVCHGRPVGRALTMLGLADTLDLYPDLELALACPDTWPPRSAAPRLNGLTRPQPPAVTESAPLLSNRVHIAVLRYLEAVADALNHRSVAVSGVETITASEGVFGGRLGLGRKLVRGGETDEVVELRWDEITGWEVALRPHRDGPRTPWRFLSDGLAPSPHLVSAFTHALLRGADVGDPRPAQFRTPDEDLEALIASLDAATAQPEPAYLQRVGYPPR